MTRSYNTVTFTGVKCQLGQGKGELDHRYNFICDLTYYSTLLSVAYLKGFSGCSRTPLGFEKLD